MNKKTYQNPLNPYDTISTSNIQTARLYLSLGWREVQATITPKAEDEEWVDEKWEAQWDYKFDGDWGES